MKGFHTYLHFQKLCYINWFLRTSQFKLLIIWDASNLVSKKLASSNFCCQEVSGSIQISACHHITVVNSMCWNVIHITHSIGIAVYYKHLWSLLLILKPSLFLSPLIPPSPHPSLPSFLSPLIPLSLAPFLKPSYAHPSLPLPTLTPSLSSYSLPQDPSETPAPTRAETKEERVVRKVHHSQKIELFVYFYRNTFPSNLRDDFVGHVLLL